MRGPSRIVPAALIGLVLSVSVYIGVSQAVENYTAAPFVAIRGKLAPCLGDSLSAPGGGASTGLTAWQSHCTYYADLSGDDRISPIFAVPGDDASNTFAWYTSRVDGKNYPRIIIATGTNDCNKSLAAGTAQERSDIVMGRIDQITDDYFADTPTGQVMILTTAPLGSQGGSPPSHKMDCTHILNAAILGLDSTPGICAVDLAPVVDADADDLLDGDGVVGEGIGAGDGLHYSDLQQQDIADLEFATCGEM